MCKATSVNSRQHRCVRFQEEPVTVTQVVEIGESSQCQYETKHEKYMRQRRIQCEIQDFKQGRRQSDDLTFSTLGLLDKISSSTEKQQQQIARQTLRDLVQNYNEFEKQFKQLQQEKEESKEEEDNDNYDDLDMNDMLALAAICETATYESRKRAYQNAIGLQQQVEQYY